jgi:hypothetical protein
VSLSTLVTVYCSTALSDAEVLDSVSHAVLVPEPQRQWAVHRDAQHGWLGQAQGYHLGTDCLAQRVLLGHLIRQMVR